jgi:hypothetical protein
MSDVLGLDHPLTRASRALDATVRQLLVVVGMLVGGVVAAVEQAGWGREVAIAAGLVLVAFAFAALIRAQTRRDRALDLILEGRESLPVSVIQRQRRRLARPRTRRSLAKTLEAMIDETLHIRPMALRSARPLLHRPLIAEAQADMRATAGALRHEDPAIRGVALVERLLSRGESPLYGRDAAALRSELARARALLAGS